MRALALFWIVCGTAAAIAGLSGCSNQEHRSLPRTNYQQATVRGGLKPAQVQSAIERNLATLEGAANGRWPGSGKVQLSFNVTADGFPYSVKLTRSSFENPELVQALEQAVQHMVFPEAKTETYVSYYPVYFR